jgi:hypothetical protein
MCVQAQALRMRYFGCYAVHKRIPTTQAGKRVRVHIVDVHDHRPV